MHNPDIKENPHPQKRYEITLTIKDAPGAFDSIKGYALYKVENDLCVPLRPISGARLAPERDAPVVLEKVTDDVYRGTIYLDLLQDEDYYGLGVCHWTMTFAMANLKVGEATFGPDISLRQIVSGQPASTYFAKRSYGDNSIKDMSYPGTSFEDIAQRRDEFFSVTLSAKEKIE